MPRWTRIRGRGRNLSPVRSPLLFLFLFRSFSGLFLGGRGRHALGRRRRPLWSGLACGWRFSGAGAAGVNRICIYIQIWMGEWSGARGVRRARR
ncbi:hypothetical protein B0H14DRAFT_3026423 [Mycena olivaceomarginata]|nr:hypothetical protein B0H14DRAFT_3026423 [Mycena olivaceomarginata]